MIDVESCYSVADFRGFRAVMPLSSSKLGPLTGQWQKQLQDSVEVKGYKRQRLRHLLYCYFKNTSA